MEYVVPIKDIESINRIKSILWKKSKRDYLLFVFGINTGIRISDLLNLQVKDVWDGEKAVDFLCIPKSEKRKEQAIFINTNVRKALTSYLSEKKMDHDTYLFHSNNKTQPITRQQAYRIINQAAKEIGLQEKIGTHTIRKTFGYHAYRKGIAISILKSIFCHTSSSETLKYIGIDKKNDHPIKVDVNL